mmetsp:Transcript_35148/g.67981  ORF Transcript_35148/g.67981 Transcript_35148/m.67981 type:complete len:101 (-) Transcript_35148:226-528(-)
MAHSVVKNTEKRGSDFGSRTYGIASQSRHWASAAGAASSSAKYLKKVQDLVTPPLAYGRDKEELQQRRTQRRGSALVGCGELREYSGHKGPPHVRHCFQI